MVDQMEKALFMCTMDQRMDWGTIFSQHRLTVLCLFCVISFAFTLFCVEI